MYRLSFGCLLFLACVPFVSAQANPRPMQIDDLFEFKRLSDPQISPDGKWVVYVQGDASLETNKVVSTLRLASTEPKKGSLKQLTDGKSSARHPRWSPDGQWILYESSVEGVSQLFAISPEKGEPKQLTKISTGANNALWSRDGKQVAFVSSVWPEFSTKPFAESDAANKQRADERSKSPVKARVFTKLFFRHWDEYVEDKRQHLFIANFDGETLGTPKDATPGDRDAYPTSSTFSQGDDFAFSPDGKFLYFTAVPAKDEAWSTNYDLCRVPVTGGTSEWETVTSDNPAADGSPQFSPDGKWLAYRAQKKPGYEADRWQLMILPYQEKLETKDPKDAKNTKKKRIQPRSLTTEFTDSVEEFLWLEDSETIYFGAEERGKRWFFSTNLRRLDGEATLTFLSHNSNHSLTRSKDGTKMAFARSAMDRPNEVMLTNKPADFETRNLSQANTELLKQLDLPRPEPVNPLGAGGVPMQMWILKPPGFDAKKKWPLVYLVHGGPQGAWNDDWSFRWNPQAWAAQGYVVALPNPRGSTGFGQQYVDEISGDWGGKVYEDLMAGLAHMEKQPWIDTDRMGAAGASFGGYMMNWFAVNTGKFKTLITHCGVWNFDSMYSTTEELWFDEWEHGGPPWGKNRDSYEKHSPHKLAGNLAKFKTPMLVIHNDLDFRVPVSEGIQLFTTLQRQQVPSKFINFPDEGHWVLKPRNSQFWHREVFDWLKKHVPPGPK
ncbi:MAG: S9 family peptidase [Gemmataceae bacterium]|nr:S9 family peptidase [Gemmataceae bacterium]